MEYAEFLNRIVDDGIEAARKSYAGRPDKLRGAVAGFESCRGKSPDELKSALETAGRATQMARVCRADNYWETRCFEAEIEWVVNCIGAAMSHPGSTVRGLMKAAEILQTDDQAEHN